MPMTHLAEPIESRYSHVDVLDLLDLLSALQVVGEQGANTIVHVGPEGNIRLG